MNGPLLMQSLGLSAALQRSGGELAVCCAAYGRRHVAGLAHWVEEIMDNPQAELAARLGMISNESRSLDAELDELNRQALRLAARCDQQAGRIRDAIAALRRQTDDDPPTGEN